MECGGLFMERFRITHDVTAGGMGTVHRAVDLVDGKSVAVKTIAPEHAANAGVVRRFAGEIAALRALTATGIPRLRTISCLAAL